MKLWKKVGLVLLSLLVLSFISFFIEVNHCHTFTTQPPPNAPIDYINHGKACMLNSYISIPATAVLFLFVGLYQELFANHRK